MSRLPREMLLLPRGILLGLITVGQSLKITDNSRAAVCGLDSQENPLEQGHVSEVLTSNRSTSTHLVLR